MSDKPAPKKLGRKPILDPELVAAALAQLCGNISRVAKRFDVHRSSVQEMIEKRPALQKILRDAKETNLDDAEMSLQKAVRNGAPYAVCFTLKTLGQSRGYIENPALYEMLMQLADLKAKANAKSGRRKAGT